MKLPIRISIWVIAIVAALAVVFSVWRHRITEVHAHTMHRGTAIQAVHAIGAVESAVNIPIAPRAVDRFIELNVDEKDIALVKAGQKVSIRADAVPDQIFDGTVKEVTSERDATVRNYSARFALPANTPLRVGMTIDSNIIVARHDKVNLLPTTAVFTDKALNYVWTAKENTLHRIEVSIGISGEQVEVLEGLNPDDLVVDIAQATFKEGQRVKIKSANKNEISK